MSDRPLRYVSSTVVGTTVVVTVRLDQIREAGAAYELRDELLSLLDDTNSKNVIFNLEQVQFVGSIGFLAFLAIRRRLAEGRVVLCRMSPQLQVMFASCRLIPTEPQSVAPFEVAETLDDALARIAA
jgi:anti-anti-sigma factor